MSKLGTAHEHPLFISKALRYYKRRDVQEAIVAHTQGREVSPRYGEGFGKRPDVLTYPQDVVEFAKRKATSFHVSEERWENPLSVVTGMPRRELDDLRTGWDLVLDIDAKDWDISRLTAWLFICALRQHNIQAISCKFSGNKGWHIGVPFESFPHTIFDEATNQDIPTAALFPELPRAIATYLVEYIGDEKNGLVHIETSSQGETTITFSPKNKPVQFTLRNLAKKAGKEPQQILTQYCTECRRDVGAGDEQYALQCPNMACMHREPRLRSRDEQQMTEPEELQCPKCNTRMVFSRVGKQACPHASARPRPYEQRLNIQEVIEFDTILLASRHLYRCAYSLHEKSGLASVVIDPDAVLLFDKAQAHPDAASLHARFLEASSVVPGEMNDLATRAWRKMSQQNAESQRARTSKLEVPEEAIPEEHFPPCIKAILAGIPDGKKRAMFALTNFLGACGWTDDMIEARLEEWNKVNPEPLREVIIRGHMHGVRQKAERILPPNCKAFYQELGVCRPDEFCSRIKNPGQYALKHVQLGARRKRSVARKEMPQQGDAPESAAQEGEST
jgi:hypothetical protein